MVDESGRPVTPLMRYTITHNRYEVTLHHLKQALTI
jgi:hypothetical protein